MSDPILHLSISQSPVFLINSRLGLFTAALARGRPFSRSYRTILPSSLAMNHSSTCGFSPRLPVSVYGTITCYLDRGFSWQYGCSQFMGLGPSSSLLGLKKLRICLELKPTGLNRLFQQTDDLPFCVPPSLKRQLGGTGILTCFPSTTPFGLALGID